MPLLRLSTPVAVPVTVNGSAVVVPAASVPTTATLYAPSGSVVPALLVPFQVQVFCPVVAFSAVPYS